MRVSIKDIVLESRAANPCDFQWQNLMEDDLLVLDIYLYHQILVVLGLSGYLH